MSQAPARLSSRAFKTFAPTAYGAIDALSSSAEAAGLEPELIDLVNLRASQLNGCAYCLRSHTTEAREHGLSDDKIVLVGAWREAGIFCEREAAALAWTESLTLIATTHAPEADFEEARRVFSERELVGLTTAILAMNVWNRIAVGFRYPPELTNE